MTNEEAQKLIIKAVAIIVKLDNGACYQLALTGEQSDKLLSIIPTLFENRVALILPEVLSLDLEIKVPENVKEQLNQR